MKGLMNQGQLVFHNGGCHGHGGTPLWPCFLDYSHAHAGVPAWAWHPTVKK